MPEPALGRLRALDARPVALDGYFVEDPVDPSVLTVEAALEGRVSLADVRMDPAVLEHQASVAEAHGNPCSERISAAPRSSAAELTALAGGLAEQGAPRFAELVRDAAAAYHRRGLLR